MCPEMKPFSDSAVLPNPEWPDLLGQEMSPQKQGPAEETSMTLCSVPVALLRRQATLGPPVETSIIGCSAAVARGFGTSMGGGKSGVGRELSLYFRSLAICEERSWLL